MKIVCKIKGGLGNQLFCYSAGRNLSIANDCELVLDSVSGFERDFLYRRDYLLDQFNIKARIATPFERHKPFERYRNALHRKYSRNKPIDQKYYIEQQGYDYDCRISSLKLNRSVYLDGYWQSEKYFSDNAKTVRRDLVLGSPTDKRNLAVAEQIRSAENAVAVHIRWFNSPDEAQDNNISKDYYSAALELITSKYNKHHLFIFSDNAQAAMQKLELTGSNITVVDHNTAPGAELFDLWLMQQCQHFIIANSTFSWWGAWLSIHQNKLVIAPKNAITTGVAFWNFKGLLPSSWMQL